MPTPRLKTGEKMRDVTAASDMWMWRSSERMADDITLRVWDGRFSVPLFLLSDRVGDLPGDKELRRSALVSFITHSGWSYASRPIGLPSSKNAEP